MKVDEMTLDEVIESLDNGNANDPLFWDAIDYAKTVLKELAKV
jgi:hypothetical protein